MLFNSYEFCLLFLPLALIVYSATGRYAGRAFALGWLLLASIVFYAWSSPSALAILGGSILLTYGAARLLTRARSARDTRGGLVMGLAVAANIAILAQFKYLEFLVEAAAALVGIEMPLVRAIPPLAISFFTFQQIAYVVDVHRGQPAERNLLRYGLFVCFFPQLIAGPIVHHKEMLPQFNRASSALSPQDLATGVTLFAIGLFKKVVVADGIVVWVTPVFEAAKFGGLAMLDAWAGTLAYTLQLYFDFSGYCDMAIGLGLMFGFRLPLNFDSPYRASSIIDFWRRWHQTLSRFLRDYLYFGLGGNRLGPTRRQINLMLTMLLGGLWHGANWTFLIWGGLHGCYLMLNHAWRGFFARTGRQA
ncbi:MAG: MBOAT family protein, partial [Deltaproteobacteria bacterium]|nr:MBOAT family protein [Deltaproteobacteria bacterium]